MRSAERASSSKAEEVEGVELDVVDRNLGVLAAFARDGPVASEGDGDGPVYVHRNARAFAGRLPRWAAFRYERTGVDRDELFRGA